MTRDEFIQARLEEISRERPWGLEDFVSGFVCSVLEILDLQQKWPVLTKEEPEPAVIYDDLSANQYVMAMTSKINWMTQQEYVHKFGTEPPTDPILNSIARIWRTHEDFNPAWA